MRLLELRLKTADLANQREFYAGVLRLPVLKQTSHLLVVQVGHSRLVFEREEGWRGAYHVAFNVPENQIEAAKAWIETRTPLVKLGETEIFPFPDWNAHALYFYDPAGNILEFIARHTLPNATHAAFNQHSILSISEIGLAAEDVLSTAQTICAALGISVYDGEGSHTFTAVGDEHGLFILVKQDRVWFPETGVAAGLHSVTITLAEAPEGGYEVPGLPYSIRHIHDQQRFSQAG